MTFLESVVLSGSLILAGLVLYDLHLEIEDVEVVEDYTLADVEQRARVDQALAYVDTALQEHRRNTALQDLCLDLQAALRPPPPDLRALRQARRPAVPVIPGPGRTNPEGAPPA